MNKLIKMFMSIFLLFVFLGSVFAIGMGNSNMMKGKGYGNNQGGQLYELYDDTQVNHQSQIDSLPKEDLSEKEKEGLLLMREEEKFARDVYLELYDIWGQQIFSNIARSEENHALAVKSLLEKYNLEDSVKSDERGIFTNQDLQKLYNSLIDKGSNSFVDALKVGATVEDLDIRDLHNLNEVSDNLDISLVYDNLEKGSRNHLRSYVRTLERNSQSYGPQYISKEYYDEILSSNMENGMSYNDSTYMMRGNNNNFGVDNNRGNQNVNIITSDVQREKQSASFFSRVWGGFKGFFN